MAEDNINIELELAVAAAAAARAAKAPAGDGSVVRSAPSKMAFVNRSLARGNPVSAVIDLTQGAMNLGVRGLNAVAGTSIPEVPEPFGGGESVTSGLRAVGVQVADRPPKTKGEKVASGVGDAAAFLLPIGFAAKALSTGKGIIGSIIADMNTFLVRKPVTATAIELAAGGGSPAGQAIAEENFGEAAGPMGAIVGSLAASLAPSAAIGTAKAISLKLPIMSKGVAAISRSVFPFTKHGGRVRASRRLRGLSSDPEGQSAALARNQDLMLTTAQRTGDERLMALEKAIINEDATLTEKFRARTSEVARALEESVSVPANAKSGADTADFVEARREYLKVLMQTRVLQATNKADQTLSILSPNRVETDNSAIVRSEIESALDDVRATEQQLYDLVDPNLRSGTKNTLAELNRIKAVTSEAQSKHIPSREAAIIRSWAKRVKRLAEIDAGAPLKKGEKRPKPITLREVHGMSSELRAIAREANTRVSGQKAARIANLLADAAFKDIEAIEGGGKLLRTAMDATRLKHEVFSQGTIGKLLGRTREGGTAIAPELTLSTAVGSGGAKAKVGLDDIRAATTGSETNVAVADYMHGRFWDFSRSNGKFSPTRANTFITRNAEALNRMPDTLFKMRQAITDTAIRDDLDAAAKARIANLSNKRASPGAAFTDAQRGSEFDTILTARNPAHAAAEILRSAKRDPTGAAVDGLKGGLYDYLMKNARGGAISEDGTTFISGRKLMKALKAPNMVPVLNKILSPDERMNLRRVAGQLVKLETSRNKAVDVGGVLDDVPAKAISLLVGVLGAQHGRVVSRATGGGTIQTPGIFANFYRGLLAKVTNDTADQLIREAVLEDPDLFEALLIGPGAGPKKIKKAQDRITAWMIGLASEQAQPNDEPEKRGAQ